MIPIFLTKNELEHYRSNLNSIKNFLFKLKENKLNDKLQARLLINDLLINLSMEDIERILLPLVLNLRQLDTFLTSSLSIGDGSFDLYERFKNLGLEKEMKEIKTLYYNLKYLLKILNIEEPNMVRTETKDTTIDENALRNDAVILETFNLVLLGLDYEKAITLREYDLNKKKIFIEYFMALLDFVINYEKVWGLEEVNIKVKKLTEFLYIDVKTKMIMNI